MPADMHSDRFPGNNVGPEFVGMHVVPSEIEAKAIIDWNWPFDRARWFLYEVATLQARRAKSA